MTIYIRRAGRVDAIEWTGNNFAEIEKFCAGYPVIGDGERAVEQTSYDRILFRARVGGVTDVWEAMTGDWIVVDLGYPDPHLDAVNVLSGDEFRAAYEPERAE